MKKDIKKLAKELRKALEDEILMRYDYPEYWNYDIVNTFYQDNKLSAIERSEIDRLLGI